MFCFVFPPSQLMHLQTSASTILGTEVILTTFFRAERELVQEFRQRRLRTFNSANKQTSPLPKNNILELADCKHKHKIHLQQHSIQFTQSRLLIPTTASSLWCISTRKAKKNKSIMAQELISSFISSRQPGN